LIAVAEALCDGRIVFTLEGGYNLTSLSHGVLNVAYALLGDPQVVDPLGPAKGPEADVTTVIGLVRQVHSLS
jgi:acetoin utilization deacetylase AcuC-like enzyme